MPLAMRLGAGALAAVLATTAIWQIASYNKARNIVRAPAGDVTITSVEQLFGEGQLPVATESIAGTPLEPVNIIVLARSEASFSDALQSAGWVRAQEPTIGSLSLAAWSAWTNRADVTAPVTPYFWRNTPNEIAFQKPTPDATLRRRHHVRFWPTEFVTTEGFRLFVGAASFDDGLDWGLLHHIDPNIDAERDMLAADLSQTGLVAQTANLRLSQPRLGQSVAGDPWFTDGHAVVLTQK
jgi:undecaprenyl-diphosphatase